MVSRRERQQKASGIELLMLAALLIVAAAGVALVAHKDNPAHQPDDVAQASENQSPSIAVLPFANSSSVAENQYFADGISEEILTNLSKVSSLRVISRTSVMKYRQSTLSIPEIARELGVTHVLEGSVQRVGDKVRIHAELIRARDDENLWAKQYDRGTADIFAVQSEIATAIASELKPHLTTSEGERLATRPTDNFEAYDLFLRARQHYARITIPDADSAVRLLRQALTLDPEFTAASALLARSYSVLSRVELPYGDSAIATARRTVAKAPDNADAHSALAESLREQGFYNDALASYRRALEIEPNHAITVAEMGELLGPYGLGRLDEAMPWIKRGIALDPAAGWVYVLLGEAWRELGDNERARTAFAAVQRVAPDYTAGATYQLALAVRMRDSATIRTTMDRIRVIQPDMSIPSLMSAYYAQAGDSAGAANWAGQITDSVMNTLPPPVRMTRRWYRGDHTGAMRETSAAERLVRDSRRYDRVPNDCLALAFIAMVRGNRSAAHTYIEKYFALGGRDESQLRNHILFAPLQSDPRMLSVIQRIHADLTAQRARVDAQTAM